MCGRYANIFDDWAECWPFQSPFHGPSEPPPVSHNIPPKAVVPVFRAGDAGPQATLMQWWLVPAWNKTSDVKYATFNARSEDAATKPAFRTPFIRRRCIVPASGFFEWRKNDDGTKTPHYITRADGGPLYFAALWDRWQGDAAVLESCAILTAAANAEMRSVHHRMPCILEPERCAAWIDPALQDKPIIESFLAPASDGLLVMHQVDRRVGNTRNNDAGLIERSA